MTKTTVTLHNGIEMPAVGLGVLQSEGQQTTDAVATALRAGYRLIDTAAAYGNERDVGRGMRDSGVDRSEIFLTTKLWMTDYGYDEALRAFDVSASKLGVEHVDLYLLHWPWPADFARTIAAFKAAERLLADGRARAIGVANFSADHLRALMAETDVTPAVNQIEVHPNFQQPDLVAANRELGIVTQAWSPIGGVYGWAGDGGAMPPLEHEGIRAIAAAHSRSSAQVILRWHLQEGRAVIPKSVTPSRIRENVAVFDFDLSDAEMQTIRSIDTDRRGAVDPDIVTPSVIDLTIDAA